MLEDCERYEGQVFVLEVDGMVAGFATLVSRVPFERLDEPPGDYALVAGSYGVNIVGASTRVPCSRTASALRRLRAQRNCGSAS